MRAIQYLTDRFEECIRYKKPLYIINRDIQALNQIITFVNENKDSTLEDSLLLFYISQTLKFQIKENNITLEQKDTKKIDSLLTMLNELLLSLNSKELIINEIYHDLYFVSKANGSKNELPKEAVEKTIENLLNYVKSTKPITQLKHLKYDTTTIIGNPLAKL